MISAEEKRKMLAVRHEVNLQAGRPIWHAPMAVAALQNLVDAAEREGSPPPARPRDGTRVLA
jgi:hypothetical protein